MTQRAKHKIRVIGRREFVDIPGLGVYAAEAKIDTGAYTSALHCENITIDYSGPRPVLRFSLDLQNEKVFRFEDFGQKIIKNSFGAMEERFVIKTVVRIGHKKIRSTISLSNRDNMRYPLLIGRRLVKGKFLIDVSRMHTGGMVLSSAIHEAYSEKIER